MVNLKDFLTNNNGLCTSEFQAAIDTASKNKQTLFVPKGNYLLGSVRLKSNTSVLFDDGVVLYGADNLNDFFPDEFLTSPLYQDVSHSSYTKSLFYGSDIKNVSIKGKAIIDMQSVWDKQNLRNSYHRGAKVIAIKNAENIQICDLTICNATDVAILLGRCKNVLINGLDLSTHIDGISPDGSENVVISNCKMLCGDDAVVIKTSLYDGNIVACKNITIKNCEISSRCNAIKFGTETTGDIENVTVSDCVIGNARCAGLAIESVDGANIKNIEVSNIVMDNVACPIFIMLGKRMRAPADVDVGSIRNIKIIDLTAGNSNAPYKSIDFWYPSICDGSDYETNGCITSNIVNQTDNYLGDITLENINLVVQGGKTLEESGFTANPTGYADVAMFGEVLPAYGIYANGAKNLSLKNVTVKTLRKDSRPDILVE